MHGLLHSTAISFDMVEEGIALISQLGLSTFVMGIASHGVRIAGEIVP
jgi:hypothetical protein